jgi:hypothetical protein
VDGHEREEAGELKGQAEAQDDKGVIGQAVADAGAATAPVARSGGMLGSVTSLPFS